MLSFGGGLLAFFALFEDHLGGPPFAG
jgi:hypothetical protein